MEDDVYKGEKPPRSYRRYALVSIIGILALLVVFLILFDIPPIEEPLHEFLSEFVPSDAFVWQFIKIQPVIELPSLPTAPDEIIDDIIEIVVDTAKDPPQPAAATMQEIDESLSDWPSGIIVPLATVTEDQDMQLNITGMPEQLQELPTNVGIPEFVTESNRILSKDARFAVVGASSIGDSFTGTVTQVRDGNSLYIDNSLLVLAGVAKEIGALKYLAEICPVNSSAVYDLDDLQSPSKDGGLYAAVWCFEPGLPRKSANQLVLESGLAGIDYSCIGSEFGSEEWLISAGCPG